MSWDVWRDRVILALAGAVPMAIVMGILAWGDVQDLKKLSPLNQKVAVLESQVDNIREEQKAQWGAISRKKDK